MEKKKTLPQCKGTSGVQALVHISILAEAPHMLDLLATSPSIHSI